MRIIAGSVRGRRILSVSKEKNVKPISARIRQSVFDILRPYVTGATFLDLYAGVGTVGLEALSRGAGSVVFIEKAGLCIKVIEKNVENLGFKEQCKILKADVLSGLKWLEHYADYEGYDVIFLSPPYRDSENLPLSYTAKTLALIVEGGIMGPGCLIIAQHHKNEKIDIPSGLEKTRQEKYGDTLVEFMRAAKK
ncbi:MAG: 16S rRNA (guanine(966)-N(2))-methyltransferase RsmD [Elusimicrobia bacterium RIFOXYA2_FULL_53_38]|nr:MAG: 16S rRNA (guanine(966)-N(2))-methyltransferase RsmD [Elusimicrobia bacterium RIFOXYA2_FULL_53_38]